jgi:hypothetical protein
MLFGIVQTVTEWSNEHCHELFKESSPKPISPNGFVRNAGESQGRVCHRCLDRVGEIRNADGAHSFVNDLGINREVPKIPISSFDFSERSRFGEWGNWQIPWIKQFDQYPLTM